MEKLSKVMMNPSGWDGRANYAGNIPDEEWLCFLSRNRDSDCLTESNWSVGLDALGGESETVQIFRFGHWACGWIEYMAVKAGSPAEPIAQEMSDRLKDYPILDEGHYTELETEEADRVWSECYRVKDRIEYIRKNRYQFDFHDYADLIGCVRGRYFSGHASELIS